MSGSSLDGCLSECLSEESGRGTYEPGSTPPERELARRLVRLYFGENLNSVPLDSVIESLTSQILSHAQEDFDPHRFLDRVVREASSVRGSVSSCQPYHGRFFTALVQSLYDVGYNDFNLDLGLLERGMAMFGPGFRGDPGRGALRLPATVASVGNLCVGSDNVNIVLHGDAYIIGCWSYNSECTVTGKVKLTNIADNNKDCVFRIGKPDPCESTLLEYLDSLTKDPYEPIIAYLGNKSFWENGNELYIPDDKGDWQGVRP